MRKKVIVVVISLVSTAICLSGCQEEAPEKQYPVAAFTSKIIGHINESVLNTAGVTLDRYTTDTIHFNALSSHDTDGNIVNYVWEFGDGQSGTGLSASHQYSESGSYEVMLTVIDNDDLSNTTTGGISIRPIPEINLSYSVANQTVNENGTQVSFNITVDGITHGPVRIIELISCTNEEWDPTGGGWSCTTLSEILDYLRVAELGNVQVFGTYIDVDNDTYVSAGDYLQYSFNTYTNPVATLTYSLRLGSHEPSPELGKIIYSFINE